MIKLNRCAVVCILSLALLGAVGVASASNAYAENKKPIEWKLLSSWGPDFKAVRYLLIPWIEAVNKKLKGKLVVTWVGPETVPPFQQLKPLRDGVFDVLFTHTAYHAGEMGFGMGLDFTPSSPAQKRKAGALKVMDEAYRKRQNVHYLGALQDGTGYHVMLREKCVSKADFSGYKIRTMPFHDPLIRGLGGATVRIPGGEVYSALDKGVVDGAAWPAVGALDYKWYEVAGYQVRPRFGETVFSLLVNLDSWNKLPKRYQEEITEITKEIEDSSRKKMISLWAEEEKELVKRGMKLCVLPKDEAKKYLNTFYVESWKFVIGLDPEYGPKLKKALDKVK